MQRMHTKLLVGLSILASSSLLTFLYCCVGVPPIQEVAKFNPSARSVVWDPCSGANIEAIPFIEFPQTLRNALPATEPLRSEHVQVARHSLCRSHRNPLRYTLDTYRVVQKLRVRFSKKEIQTICLNESYFGENAVGVQQAARTLMHKDAKDLSLSESALPVGLLRVPGRCSPSNIQMSPRLAATRFWI
jgi:Transglycosylase